MTKYCEFCEEPTLDNNVYCGKCGSKEFTLYPTPKKIKPQPQPNSGESYGRRGMFSPAGDMLALGTALIIAALGMLIVSYYVVTGLEHGTVIQADNQTALVVPSLLVLVVEIIVVLVTILLFIVGIIQVNYLSKVNSSDYSRGQKKMMSSVNYCMAEVHLERTCPKCGSGVGSKAQFCSSCGCDLNSETVKTGLEV